MRKLVLSLVMVATLATSAVFAQDRSIGAYIDTSIDNLIDTDKVNNLTTEFGVNYAQNFVGMEWLTAGLTIYGEGTRGLTKDSSSSRDEALGSWDDVDLVAELGLTISGSVFGVEDLEIGLAVDTDVNINLEFGYGLEIGPGALGLWLGADFNGYPDRMSEFFSDVYFGVEYALGITDIFGLVASVEAAYGDDDLTVEVIVDFVAELEGGFSAYAGLGFALDNTLPKGDVGTSLAIRGGISYAFDL